MSGKDALFLQSIKGAAIGPLMYLGAKHMVTGYDHLAFLVGVIFFSATAEGHRAACQPVHAGPQRHAAWRRPRGIHANPNIIDAIIGFSVVYKAFDNMDGFQRFFGVQPNTRAAVLVFGLFHGFGLATKLQEFQLAPNGLITNIVSFNVGVEIGQVLALTGVLIALSWWRTRSGFFRHAFVTNTALMACGFLLVGFQLSGYVVSTL